MSPNFVHLGLTACFLLCSVPPAVEAQQRSVSDKIDQVLAELRQIRKLLDGTDEVPLARAERVVLGVGDAPMLGSLDAPVTIIGSGVST